MIGIIFIIIGYLLGSLNSAIIVCKLMGLPDPRTEGSGNPGATNVLRIAGKFPAAFVLVGDVLKGFIPVLLAKALHVPPFMLALVALAATLGHVFPVFYHFKGGKGVATGFGGVIVLSVWVAIIAAIAWILVVLITRYVSLASMVAAVIAALFMLFVHTSYFLPVAAISVLIIWRHWENINRLKAGTENKIDLKF